ncbi:MAG TPA: cytochrome P450 [Beijerinckiaceae bacterium]|nr:cytochrome P450 [Beijerinckiaceae bacterium]
MRHWFSDLPAFRRDPLGFLLEKARAGTEPLEPLALGPKPVFLLRDPDLIRPLMRAGENEVDKGRLVHKLRPIVGLSSLVISGEEHKRRRAALHEHLARGEVERLIPQLSAEIRAFAGEICRNRLFDPHQVSARLALRLICTAVFGRRVLSPADEEALIVAVNAAEEDLADEMFRVWPLTPWAAFARGKRRAAAKRMMSVVVERLRKNAAETSALRSLEALGLAPDDLRDEILTLLLAGHHTTGSTAAWLLYHLAVQPGLGEAVAAEAARCSNRNGEITAEGLKKAELSYAFVREVLRLYPAAWWFSRELRTKAEFGGRKLPKGSSIIISPWQLHRDPNHWADPDAFRLDRSYTGRAYVPFGAGPRACIGMGLAMLELQLLALELASAYRFEHIDEEPPGRPKASVTLIPPPMRLWVQVRQSDAERASAA